MPNYIEKLPEDAVQVKNALCWVTPAGNLYGQETRTVYNKKLDKKIPHKHYGEFFQYNTTVNRRNGYVYAPIKYIKSDGTYEIRRRRLHIVIAETLLPNPNKFPIVGHKNNIKTDISLSNLYWTTISENTKKAFDDGLAVNAKGYDDSQSIPVIMFNTYTNEEIGRYGSASEAVRETGIPKNTVLRQCRYKKPVRKPFYFRFQSDPSVEPPQIVIQYDYETDREIGRYFNV